MLSGPEMWPLYGVERWPHIRGFLSTILNGHAVGTEVSVRYRQGGRTLEVVVKRGSTVYMYYQCVCACTFLYMHVCAYCNIMHNNPMHDC